jgi:hypothetical protein
MEILTRRSGAFPPGFDTANKKAGTAFESPQLNDFGKKQ